MRESYLIRGSRVCFNGRISRYGIITVIDEGLPDPESSFTGLELWSPALLKYTQRGVYKAQVKGTSIVVLKKKKVVDHIHIKNIDVVDDKEKCIVMRNGYLLQEDMGGDSEFRKMYAEALALADKGEKPPIFDNSSFVKVDSSFARRRIILLSFDLSDRRKKAFTFQGQEVPCQVRFPLSYKKWGVNPTSHKGGSGGPSGILEMDNGHMLID